MMSHAFLHHGGPAEDLWPVPRRCALGVEGVGASGRMRSVEGVAPRLELLVSLQNCSAVPNGCFL